MVHLLDLGVDVAVLADSIGAQLASCETVVFWAADFLYVDARLANAVLIHGLRNSVLWCGQLELGTPPSSVHIDRNTTHWATSSSCRYCTSIPFAHRLTWRPKYATGRRGPWSGARQGFEKPCAAQAKQVEGSPACANTRLSWQRPFAASTLAAA